MGNSWVYRRKAISPWRGPDESVVAKGRTQAYEPHDQVGRSVCEDARYEIAGVLQRESPTPDLHSRVRSKRYDAVGEHFSRAFLGRGFSDRGERPLASRTL